MLENYINDEAIIQKIIAIRCKYAESVYKFESTDQMAHHSDRKYTLSTEQKFFYSLFPSRKEWAHLNYEKRKNLNQVARNRLMLWYTVLREQKKQGHHSEWYIRLISYVAHIKRMTLSPDYSFHKPVVVLLEKKREGNTIECRPVCKFSKDDKIIASLVNRALTHLFDGFFYQYSYAFRAVTARTGRENLAHLEVVKEIKEFRKNHAGTLHVAECDMKKFYDTIDHDIIKQRFCQLLRKCKCSNLIEWKEFRLLKNMMYSYIDCFNFYQDIYCLNNKPDYPVWQKIKAVNGEKKKIGWIIDDLKTKGWKYRTRKHFQQFLGVPQGGALSGLIANMVMHFTDLHLKEYWHGNTDFRYIRFCDDMIMVGNDSKQVSEAFEAYLESVTNSHLFYHPLECLPEKKMKNFWKGKSRGPYAWGNANKNIFPWITFVGYDINWEGDTRIRKASLKKEIVKQYKKVEEIRTLFSTKKRRVRKPKWYWGYICTSVERKMIGMSVGRVPLWDYKNHDNKYSWTSAFSQLTPNRWSAKQLKRLDWHRQKMLGRLFVFLTKKVEFDKIHSQQDKQKKLTVNFYGKPYSYYGQCLKKWDT